MPRANEYLKTLVDGCHWPNHTGCSEGFNSKNYKESIPRLNTQIHTLLWCGQRCQGSLGLSRMKYIFN